MTTRTTRALRRTTTSLALGAAALLVGAIAAPAAFAADAPLPALTVQPGSPTTADQIVISGSGCIDTTNSGVPSTVNLTVDPSDDGVIVVDVAADGTWTTTGTVSGPGNYNVKATCVTYDTQTDYPAASFVATAAEPATVTVAPTTVTAGGTVQATGANFRPGEAVSVVLNSDPVLLGTITADADGNFAGSVTIPAGTVAGTHTLVFTGAVSGRTVSVTITVRGVVVTVSVKGGLANTGTPAQNIALAGLGLVGVGTTLTMVGRRRSVPTAG